MLGWCAIDMSGLRMQVVTWCDHDLAAPTEVPLEVNATVDPQLPVQTNGDQSKYTTINRRCHQTVKTMINNRHCGFRGEDARALFDIIIDKEEREDTQ